jgi:hypothetical protein
MMMAAQSRRQEAMRRHILVSAVTVFVAAFAPAVAASQATTSTTNIIIDETIPVENPCTGEFIVFTLRAHLLFHTTADANGGTHRLDHVHGQRVSGVSNTGTRYQGKLIETTVDQDNGSNAQNTSSFLSRFHIVSQGGSDNFFATFRTHVTIQANGEATATFSDVSAECRG